MKIHVLLNAFSDGDGVSSHCALLRRRALELNVPAAIYAEFSSGEARGFIDPPEALLDAGSDDILLHQFFNETSLLPYVNEFPGRRVLMYHNITPPRFFRESSPVRRSCEAGLRQVQSLAHLYDYAVGMSEFSRQQLESMGYESTGVFPLLVDIARLKGANAGRAAAASGIERPLFLSVARIAPNKHIEDLFHLLAAYRRQFGAGTLVVAGDREQHPEYTKSLLSLARKLALRDGRDVFLPGKISDAELAAYYGSADAYVSMSEHEGFCAPLIEAMAFDLPVFAYRAGACEETLAGSAVLFASKDHPSIAGRVHEILTDQNAREEVLESQRRRLHDFSPEQQRRQLRDLLATIRALPRREYTPRTVSVVVNTFNRSRELERCLATLAGQTYRAFEVVVVNGPSTDDTEDVLRRFENQIKIASVPARILGVSRNEGIARAGGELVAFIDDDAIADPNWLAELAPVFDDPTVGAAGGLVYRMDGCSVEFRNGTIDREGFVLWDEPHPGVHWTWDGGRLNTVSGNNCIFRRSALEQIGGFDERIEYYHDEADVIMRLRKIGLRTVHRPKAIVYHEAANSLNRRSQFDLNWFAVTKNTGYCALKNYDGERPRWQVACRIAARLVHKHVLGIAEAFVNRQLGVSDFAGMELATFRGIIAGIRRGLDPAPLFRQFPARESAITPFGSAGRRALTVCLLSQELPGRRPGGIATYTDNLARGLRDCGCEVHVISRGDSRSPELRRGIWYHQAAPVPLDRTLLREWGTPIVRRNLEYACGVWKRFLDIEARWNIDVVESPNWDVEGLFIAMDHRRPLVARAHSPVFQVASEQGWTPSVDLDRCSALEECLLRRADVVTGSTQAVLNLVRQRFASVTRTELLPLGLDPETPELPCPLPPRKTVLFVGRLERRKGIHTLLECMPEVLEADPEAEFAIAGRDENAGEDSWAEKWTRETRNRFGNRVRFVGEVDAAELQRLYRSCYVLAAPSTYESFGLIYLEAMAQSRPVIGCRTGGIPEVVADGENGLLVPADSPAELAAAIRRILSDRELAERFGRAGRERYERLFTTAIMAENTAAVYRRVVAQRKRAAECIWRASAIDFRRLKETEVVWHPESGRVCLRAPAGVSGTVVYGPYLALSPGMYRAEFKLFAGGAPQPSLRIGAVDVFSIKCQQQNERVLEGRDFLPGPGTVADVFFTVPDPPPNDYEFRVISAGAVPLYIREIAVSRWPGSSFESAMNVRGFPIERAAAGGAMRR